ncbi:type II secretion system F family protein [Desulfohalovibrio reitneri]|uniref:type II secretion system F family protein n=1 Tax=Desulfohalovibrio reitneri TaxID=1307759 RepID=UPI0004A6C6E0|nr:type II secretion system F family protein [Desulfohalovibrio reitneri]
MNADPTILLAAGMAFLAVLSLSWGIMGFIGGGEAKKLRARMDRAWGWPGEEEAEKKQTGWRFGAWLHGQVERMGRRVAPKDREALSDLRVKLMQAGFRSPDAPTVFWGARLALVSIFVTSMFFLRVIADSPDFNRLFVMTVALAAAAGYYLPDIWLRHVVTKRRLAIANELPDALDLLVVCVESGMGMDQAISRVAREMAFASPNISREFRLLNLELRAGKKRHDALRNMASRVGLDDVDSLVTLIIQADAFGTSVASTLRVYSDTMRTKRFQKAEETAAKLPVKLLFPLVLFILPALFVVIIGPAALQLMDVFTRIN